jgi:tetratricopeptide (TPR) repeat protein
LNLQTIKYRRIPLCLFGLFFFAVFVYPLAAQNDSIKTDWVQQSIDLTINGRFDEAEILLKKRIADGHEDLETYFYYASLLNSKMTHYENFHNDSLFLIVIDSVIKKADRLLKNIPQDSLQTARILFYKGSAVGYLAFYQGQTGKWLAAFNNGMDAIDYLEQAAAYDSALYDAYLGIGVYKYWKSTKLKAVLWLPFVKDERAEGIRLIRKATDSSSRSKYMGMHQLIYILLDYGDFYRAKQYALEAIDKYPQSQFMWWAYAHTLYKMHDNADALKTYEHLLEMINNDPQANLSHKVTCRLRMAEIYKRMNDVEACRNQCRLIINDFKRDNLSDNGKKDYDKAKEMMKKCGD